MPDLFVTSPQKLRLCEPLRKQGSYLDERGDARSSSSRGVSSHEEESVPKRVRDAPGDCSGEACGGRDTSGRSKAERGQSRIAPRQRRRLCVSQALLGRDQQCGKECEGPPSPGGVRWLASRRPHTGHRGEHGRGFQHADLHAGFQCPAELGWNSAPRCRTILPPYASSTSWRALSTLAARDQLSIDKGSWTLASELVPSRGSSKLRRLPESCPATGLSISLSHLGLLHLPLSIPPVMYVPARDVGDHQVFRF